MRVILLNGPKLSGKTTAANQYVLGDQMHEALPRILGASEPMKRYAIKSLGIEDDKAITKLIADFEGMKDTPQLVLQGLTPRQFYIVYGHGLRSRLGETIVADLWLKDAALLTHQCTELIVPNVRFPVEVDAAITLAGYSNVLLVHVRRPGCSWAGDIGSYLPFPAGRDFTLVNDGPASKLGAGLERLVTAWIGGAEYCEAHTGAGVFA